MAGFGDSKIERGALHCDLVEKCRNLNQLYGVVDRLVVRCAHGSAALAGFFG